MKSNQLPTDQYWVTLQGEELAGAIMQKFKDYRQTIETTMYADKIRRSCRMYYGVAENGSFSASHGLTEGGDAGEITLVNVNQYRSLAQSLLSLITQQKISTKTKATNKDADVMKLTRLGDGVVEYFFRAKKLSRRIKRAVELAIVALEGYVGLDWDATIGKPVMVNPETGQPIYSGDLVSFTLTALDVARDTDVEEYDDCQWKITRRLFNRWELIATYPDLADDLLDISAAKADIFSDDRPGKHRQGDQIPVFTLYHEKTKAVPNGLIARAIDDRTLLGPAGALPFKKIPLYRCSTAEILKTAFGYSTQIDLLPLQQINDVLWSALVSNNKNFAAQNIWTKKGDSLSTSELGGGIKHIQSNETPVPIQLTKSAPESYNLLDKAEATMQVISGVNSVIRGNPEASLESGAALAMVASQAVIFTSGLQESYVGLVEDVGTGCLDTLKTFAKYPQMAEIAGKDNSSFMQEFVGNDLSGIDGVTVETANATLATAAGRTNMADKLLEKGLVTSAKQYLEVVETGNIEPLIESDISQLELIRKENEMIREGKNPVVLQTDHPILHLQEHLSVLDDPFVRQQPPIMQAATDHAMMHLQQWAMIPPALLMVRNIPPMPQPMMPMVPPMGAGGPPGPHPGPGGGVGKAMNAQNPTAAEGMAVKGPNMPNLPAGAPPNIQQAFSQLKG